MFCDNCGKELVSGDLYCNNCGKKIKIENVEKKDNSGGRKAFFIVLVVLNCLIYFGSIMCSSFVYLSADMFSKPDALIDSLSFLGVFVSIFGGALGITIFGIGMYIFFFISICFLIVNVIVGIVDYINTKKIWYIFVLVFLILIHILLLNFIF